MEREIIDYMVVENSTPQDVVSTVKRLLDKGFVPFGGICVSKVAGSYGIHVLYVQAMVKYGEPKNKEPVHSSVEIRNA